MVIGDTRFKQSWIPIVVVSFAPRGTAEGPITKLCSKFLFVRSERPEIPDINNQNKGSLMETNVTETLLDSPYPSEAILAAIKLIDFSWMDWIRILNTQCCPYSEHRDAFRTSASMQAESLATSVYDNDPCDASLDLARRIEALQDIFKYAIL